MLNAGCDPGAGRIHVSPSPISLDHPIIAFGTTTGEVKFRLVSHRSAEQSAPVNFAEPHLARVPRHASYSDYQKTRADFIISSQCLRRNLRRRTIIKINHLPAPSVIVTALNYRQKLVVSRARASPEKPERKWPWA